MKIKHARVLPVAAATLATAAVGFATTAQAFDFKVSGQVDRAVTAVDNGKKSDIGFVDNNGSNTRFRFVGSQEMDNNTTLGFTYEIGLDSAVSSSWDVNSNGNYDEVHLDTRYMNVWMEGNYGKVAFGKISAASDGTSEVTYDGTAFLGGGMDYMDFAGGVSFLTNDGTPIASVGYGSSRGLSGASDEFDGFGRTNGVVYTTPSLNGFTISGGLYDGHAFDIAPRFETSFGDGGKFAIAADYADSQDLNRTESPSGQTYDDPRFKEYGASTSVLLPSGFNATLVYKHRKTDNPYGYAGAINPTTGSIVQGDAAEALGAEKNDSADNYFGSLGYILGKHNFAVSYGQTHGYLNKGSKLQQIGASYLYNWTNSVALYASYHHYMLSGVADVDNSDIKDIDQIYAGVRVKFL